jgi:hypothetical protein
MLELLLLAFCAGIIVKAVDWMDDDQIADHPAKYPLAALYGTLIGYMIAVSPFSILFLAAVAAQVFATKVDTTAHRIGLAAAMLVILAIGIPVIDIPVFIIFLVAAFLDEIDYVGNLRPLTEWRPFLKCAALAFALFGRYEYFLAIVAFDVGYELFRFIASKSGAKKPETKGSKPPAGKKRAAS